MNLGMKFIIFSICLNVAIGALITAFPDMYNKGQMGGLVYQKNYASNLTTDLEKVITPSGELEDQGNQIYRVLDLTIMGFIERLLNTIKNLVWGFARILDRLVGPSLKGTSGPLGMNLYDYWFSFPTGAAYMLTNLAYIFTAIMLWIGKDIKS